MSEVVDVPDDSPPRSPEVECPYSEEGSSEKTMETRKRAADAVDKQDEGYEEDDDVTEITPKKAKNDETEVEQTTTEEVVIEEPVLVVEEVTVEEVTVDESSEEAKEEGEEDDEDEENGAEEEQETDE